MSQNRLDSAYRRWLHGRYTYIGFDRVRVFIRPDGSSWAGCPCYYCGEPATSEDHTMPLVQLRSLIAVGADDPQKKYPLVPSCHECNLVLSTKRFPDLVERKRFIKQRLRSKYWKVLAIPPWHENDIEALGYTLRSNIREGIVLKRRIQERLAW